MKLAKRMARKSLSGRLADGILFADLTRQKGWASLLISRYSWYGSLCFELW